MKVAILILACLSYLAAAQNVAFNGAATASCTNAGGCSLASILTLTTITDLITGSGNLNLDFSGLSAGSTVTLDSSLTGTINVNSIATGTQTTVIVASGYTVNTANFVIQSSSSAVVAGTVAFKASASSSTNFTIDATSSLYVQTSGAIQAGASNIVAQGQANVAGSISTTGSYAQNAGNLVLNSTGSTQSTATAYVYASAVTIASGATLTGNGIIGGSSASAAVAVSVSGTISIGNSPGTVTINGDWRPSGTSVFKLEVASQTSYDQLIVTGKAYVNGGLQVALINNYGPGPNTRFPFISASSTAGSFSTTIGTNPASAVNKWSSSVAATQVIANFNSAVSVAISGLVLVACVLASLL